MFIYSYYEIPTRPVKYSKENHSERGGDGVNIGKRQIQTILWKDLVQFERRGGLRVGFILEDKRKIAQFF